MSLWCLAPSTDTVSVDVQRDLRSIYTAQFELLRHFWTCFPSTSAQLEEKVSTLSIGHTAPTTDLYIASHLITQMSMKQCHVEGIETRKNDLDNRRVMFPVEKL